MDEGEGDAAESMMLDGEKAQVGGCGQVNVRRDGCVEVEVWVNGTVCVSSNPNTLPLGGNSASLVKMIELLNPSISTNNIRFNHSRWAGK